MVEIGAYEEQERLQGIPNGHDRIREGVTAGGLGIGWLGCDDSRALVRVG